MSFVSLKGISKSYDGKVMAVSNITFDVEEGEFFSILGPSGCGKTTVLRMIAGLEVPDRGEVYIGNVPVAGKGWVPPEKRGVGFVFQDYALFPHMTVFENIAFGIRNRDKGYVKRVVGELLDLVGLYNLEDKYPYQLSAGQQQRVALARALAPFPKVLLMDEPFSNLDAELRAELRVDTKAILKEKGITTILVTHDQEEALSLSDRIAIMKDGKLEQIGTPYDIYHRPSTRFVASFVGEADFIPGRLKGNVIITDVGTFTSSNGKPIDTDTVDVMIRPEDVDFQPDEKGRGIIVDLKFLGPDIIYKVKLENSIFLHSIKPSVYIYPVGTRVSVRIEPTHVVVFPRI